ncbi:hypothetical protein V7S43_000258 [Phytophthora oleae]|uniref:Uncharacterized protein n=1 Tax=Phytophthora oleae TaxID=2107226 RepID=A0ABD3G5S3_9STRA
MGSREAIDRTMKFLMDRGITRTQALRALAHHILVHCCFSQLSYYTSALMESKIKWLSDLGLSNNKINDVIVRNPNFLIDMYETVVNWYIATGVPRNKTSKYSRNQY